MTAPDRDVHEWLEPAWLRTEPYDDWPLPQTVVSVDGVELVAEPGGLLHVTADGDTLTLSVETNAALSLDVAVLVWTLGPDTYSHTIMAEHVRRYVYAWARCRTRADRMFGLASLVNVDSPPRAGGTSPAQWLFGQSASVLPSRRDGCYRAGGLDEPFPGAWPRRVVAEALASASLAPLWPYLPEAAAAVVGD